MGKSSRCLLETDFKTFLEEDQKLIFGELCDAYHGDALTTTREALDKIRPFLQRDGGDIEFVELTEDMTVKVRLQGHCAGCPGAQMTIKGVVERIIKESYPEIKGVESV